MIREAGLAAVPGVCFGTEGYIRLSYCYSDRELQESLGPAGRICEKAG